MLAIIKIDESFAVVDLDEDTELFESMDEAEDLMIEYMSQKRLNKYRAKRDTKGTHAIYARIKSAEKDTDASDDQRKTFKKFSDKTKKQVKHMNKRLKLRSKIIKKMKSKGKEMKSVPAK